MFYLYIYVYKCQFVFLRLFEIFIIFVIFIAEYRYLMFPDVKYYSGKYNSTNDRRYFFFISYQCNQLCIVKFNQMINFDFYQQ